MAGDLNTAEKIMDIAQEMVQTRGYHAFSYRDISDQIGIKTASIHYYYPAKADLAKAMLARIRGMFEEGLAGIDATDNSAEAKLRQFAGIFLETYGEGRLCPFCMMATTQRTIPESVQDEVRGFWSRGEEWVESVLEEGQDAGEFKLPDSAQLIARMMVSSFEGAMVVARAFDDKSRLEATVDFILSLVKVNKPFTK
ncbi:MAG: TetR/AcrR family transcriptional regulator [Gammaproteobacteria bacterium]